MDQPPVTPEMMDEAHRRALRHAPLPEWDPVTAGIAMAAAFVVPMILIQGLTSGVSIYALILNAAAGFAVGLFGVKSRRDAYHRAWNRELEALKGPSDDPPPPPPTRPIPKWLLRRS